MIELKTPLMPSESKPKSEDSALPTKLKEELGDLPVEMMGELPVSLAELTALLDTHDSKEKA